MTRPDDWLDAFDPDALDDPDLARVDDAVSRVIRRLDVSPASAVSGPPGARARGWGRVAVAAALAAGVLIGLALARTPRAPEPAVVEPDPVAVPESVAEPIVEPALVVPDAAPPIEAPTARVAAAPVEPPRANGLLVHPGADVEVLDGAAVLSKGLVTFVRDAGHDPGVDRVRWSDVPVVARPVGTVFTAIAAPAVAALDVSEGRVDLELPDGTPLASLRTGLELTVVIDPAAPRGLRVLYTDHMPLDVVRSMVPTECACRPEDVVAAVAGLRFAGESPLVPPVLEDP